MINNKQQELKDLMAKTQKYELLMRRLYSGTTKFKNRTGDFVLRNLILKEQGALAISIESFDKQLANIKEYLKYGIVRFMKQHPQNEGLQHEIHFWLEQIDAARYADDIVHIVTILYNSPVFMLQNK